MNASFCPRCGYNITLDDDCLNCKRYHTDRPCFGRTEQIHDENIPENKCERFIKKESEGGDVEKLNLINAASTIKKYCENNSVYFEAECPFFRGYVHSKDLITVKCALNLGNTSPANWDITEKMTKEDTDGDNSYKL